MKTTIGEIKTIPPYGETLLKEAADQFNFMVNYNPANPESFDNHKYQHNKLITECQSHPASVGACR
jgi:negative regulator of sigma E activity